MIYLNNAATTFPKPQTVVNAVHAALIAPPVEPGRAGGDVDPTRGCRETLADLFGVAEPRRVILTPSATHALNLVIYGRLLSRPGSHVVTTTLEHNSILRPLAHLRRNHGIRVTHLEPASDGRVDPAGLLEAARSDTRLIAVTHASNVTGCVQPVEDIALIAAEMGIPLLIDASQSAGSIPLDHGRLPGRVFVAAAGHKGLFGPMGTGVLIVPDERLAQVFVGGTGVQSDNPLHPSELPLRYEAGTMNLPGIAGLTAGVRFVQDRGVDNLGRHRHRLIHRLRNRLRSIDGCRLSPLANDDGRAGIVSLTLEGGKPDELGFALQASFDIETRIGLHCAPLVHRSLGTLPDGSVRASVAAFNTNEDVEALAEALTTLRAACAT
jgi:cysteine desulfurase / selenocysteine lyase